MKKLLLLFMLLVGIQCFSQSTLIPDANFEQALIDLNIDTDGLNGSILNSDAQQFMFSLDVSSKNISDLTGIEAFINIPELDCSYNNLSTLDLSFNNLLKAVSARNNNLLDINLSNIQALEAVTLENNQLDSLDFSVHPSLYWLMCFTNNLTYLNISSNANLAFLSCGENQLTGNLDISNLWQLEFFACRYNQLSYVNTWIHPYMTIFNCQNNDLWELDLSNCPSLEQVYADSNNLVAFNMKNFSNSSIIDFHAEGNPNLYCIQVDDSVSSTNDPNWIEDSQSYYSEACNWVGIAEIDNSNFKILPNPASDWLFIEMDNPEISQIEICDFKGKILLNQTLSEKGTVIDIRNLSSGSYLLRIGQSVERFIKK